MITEGSVNNESHEWKWQVVSEINNEELNRLSTREGIPLRTSQVIEDNQVPYFHMYHFDYSETQYILHLPVWKLGAELNLKGATDSLHIIMTRSSINCFVSSEKHHYYEDLIIKAGTPFEALSEIIVALYEELLITAKRFKIQIEEVQNEAKDTANRDVLLKLTQLEQELVIFSHQINNKNQTITRLLGERIVRKEMGEYYVQTIQLIQEKVDWTVHLYKELVESTSGLLSDSIDNKLNNIMEYLESAALIISIPTLIFSLFGMNTGGLVGRHSPIATIVVIGVSIILGFITAWYLKKKEFL